MAAFSSLARRNLRANCLVKVQYFVLKLKHTGSRASDPEYGGFASFPLTTRIILRGFLGSARLSDYCASKWALLGFAVPWQIKCPDDSNVHKSIRCVVWVRHPGVSTLRTESTAVQQCRNHGCVPLLGGHPAVWLQTFSLAPKRGDVGCWMLGWQAWDLIQMSTKLRMFRGAFEGADRSTWFRRCVGWLRCCWLFQLADLNLNLCWLQTAKSTGFCRIER